MKEMEIFSIEINGTRVLSVLTSSKMVIPSNRDQQSLITS